MTTPIEIRSVEDIDIRKEISAEDLLGNPALLEEFIRGSLDTRYSKWPRRIITHISGKGIDVYGYEHRLTGSIMSRLKTMMANNLVRKDEYGYRLVKR